MSRYSTLLLIALTLCCASLILTGCGGGGSPIGPAVHNPSYIADFEPVLNATPGTGMAGGMPVVGLNVNAWFTPKGQVYEERSNPAPAGGFDGRDCVWSFWKETSRNSGQWSKYRPTDVGRNLDTGDMIYKFPVEGKFIVTGEVTFLGVKYPTRPLVFQALDGLG
jgi:hypothetical protein